MPGILIADDNQNIRYLLRVYIESQTPFKVCGEAVNGTDTIEKAQQLLPELVMLDFSMPLMTGIEAASVLKRMLPQTKILLFSLNVEGMPKSLVAELGVDLAFSKGDAFVGLAERLNYLLEPPLLQFEPPAPTVETLPAGSEIQTTTDKPNSETFKTDA